MATLSVNILSFELLLIPVDLSRIVLLRLIQFFFVIFFELHQSDRLKKIQIEVTLIDLNFFFLFGKVYCDSSCFSKS